MTKTFVVQYQTREGSAQENRQLIESVFAELNGRAPDGFRYLSLGLADGTSFIHIAVYEGASDPLTGSPAFQRFLAGSDDRIVGKPFVTNADFVGSYRF